jgi:hypothetical protein
VDGLRDLLDARITETVATTKSEDGEPNSAPMGVLRDEGVYARLWEGSTTLENVRATNEVVVNFTRDPVVYVESALGDPDGEFVVDGRLRDADGWVRCDAERVPEQEDRDEVTRWRLTERDRRVAERVLPTHSRGFASVIEATVHATRLEFEPELRELLEHHLEVARKCGGEREVEAADLIEKYV